MFDCAFPFIRPLDEAKYDSNTLRLVRQYFVPRDVESVFGNVTEDKQNSFLETRISSMRFLEKHCEL